MQWQKNYYYTCNRYKNAAIRKFSGKKDEIVNTMKNLNYCCICGINVFCLNVYIHFKFLPYNTITSIK